MIFVADTIIALSSGRTPSGVAIVRLSGSGCRFALETICGLVPQERVAAFVRLRKRGGESLDSGLAFYFPAPRSFTGEDCAEFHVHGSRAVIAALIAELVEYDGIRLAEAGEFTKRAFLNGKLDLTGAEALADLIDAETEAQRRLSFRNFKGEQLALYDSWRRQLLDIRALVEADLDFADEGDVGASVAMSAWEQVPRLCRDIAQHISGFARAELIREGVHVVIVGAPNAGKSSLLNVLAGRDVAIVSDEPGTTRDLLEVVLDLDGVKVVVTDTAGLRETGNKVEAEGVARAKARAREAQLVLFLEDMSDPKVVDLEAEDVPRLLIGTKADIHVARADRRYDTQISVKDGRSIDALVERLSLLVGDMTDLSGQTVPSRQRHVGHLQACLEELTASLHGTEAELRAEHLRSAADALGRIVGHVDVEDLLGAIFSRFCVGK